MRTWVKRTAIAVTILTVLSGGITYGVIKHSVANMFGGHTNLAKVSLPIERQQSLIITNVNVLVPTADAFIPNQTVGIKDGKITAVGDAVTPPEGAGIIDGQGMYLSPGYTDSHVHLWKSENDLLLYVANGVTQVREMHGNDLHLNWKSEVQNGRLGPEIYVVAAQMATYDFWEGLWVSITAGRNVVRSEADVRRKITALKNKGFDAVKASSFLSSAGYKWASQEAGKQNIPLAGHIPIEATLDDFWSSSQSEVAHVEEFVKVLNREFGGYKVSNTEDYLAYVRERSPEVAQRALERGIYVTSTLALIQSLGSQQTNLNPALKAIELDYVNPGLTEGRAMGWLPHANRYRIGEQYKTDGWQDRQNAYWSAYVKAQKILFTAFMEAGVPIMAGTDANVPAMVPGFSLHEEMKAMQLAGMSPAKILASATTIPAEWMGWQTGQIKEGFDANLVLLRENPLENIEATNSIEMVFVNGHVLGRDDLNALLQAVKESNEASRKISIEPFR